MYMLIVMTLFQNYGEKRLDYVKRYYDAISQFKINILTVIMAGLEHWINNLQLCVVDTGDGLKYLCI